MEYDRLAFTRIACEVGIVGAVEETTSKFIVAEFEYSRKEHLQLNWDEACVLHPMFYRYFRIKPRTDLVIYPMGPDHATLD